MPSLRRPISAWTQAGGGHPLLRFASSIQSCCGEGGALQADVAVCGEHSPCSGQAASSFGALSPGAVRLFSPRRAAPAARGLRAFSAGAVCLFRPAARGLRVLYSGAVRLFPPRRAAATGGVSGSPYIGTGPVCRVGGGGFSGAEFAPCPSPCLLPPAGVGRLFSGVSQPLCFANHRGVFWPVNFSALPQFKKSLPPTAVRAFWPVLTLSNAAGSSPLRPLLLVAGAGVWGTFLLGVAFRHVICGPYLISPPG